MHPPVFKPFSEFISVGTPGSCYLAVVSAQVAVAGGSVLTGVWRALVHLLLAVAPGVSDLAVAVVNVPGVQALTRVPAQRGHVHPYTQETGQSGSGLVTSGHGGSHPGSHALTSLLSRHFTGDARDVTVKPRPAGLTLAAVGRPRLPARSPVLTGRRVAPADQVLQGANIAHGHLIVAKCLPL